MSRAKTKQARLQRAPRAPRASTGTPRPRKPNEADEAAARGVMPEKPVIASPTNQHYQKRLDKLAELAEAGDWDAIRAYSIKGANTYAKMVVQYRDRLLTAHDAAAAQQQG